MFSNKSVTTYCNVFIKNFSNFKKTINTCDKLLKSNDLFNQKNRKFDDPKELLKYLENECLLIESKYDGLLAEFDLLIASQFIIYYIGKVLDVDVSKPKYSADAMKIYFYKGDL